MDVVTDTNIFLAVALNEPEKARIIKLTSGITAIAPEILPYEIGNALSAMVKRRKIPASKALEILKMADRIPVRLMNVNVQASVQIAAECGIYAYDAYFLQCAKTFSCRLLTLDKRLQQAAKKTGIRLLE